MIYPTTNLPPAPWEVSKHRGEVLIDHRTGRAYFQPDSTLDKVATVAGRSVVCGAVGAATFAVIMVMLRR